jgi:hypothetical protein
VTISGTNLGANQGSSIITFASFAASPTSWNDTQIVTPVPNGATTGSVIVITGGGQSNGLPFTVTVPMPTIASLSPNSGNIGDSVTIGGSNFGATQGSSAVTFNGTAAGVTSWNATQIIVTVPSGATTGPVVVTTGNGASNGVAWTLVTPVGVMPKLADLTYPDPACAQPPEQASGKKWYFNPNTAGVSPTQYPGHTAQYWANNPPTSGYVGDAQHPYDNVKYGVFGANFNAQPPTGYTGFPPLLSTIWSDHRVGVQGGTGSSPVNGTSSGPDWGVITATTPPSGYQVGDMYPHTPDPTRINPGDEIILESGNYGSFATSNNMGSPVNADANGNTKFVFMHGDAGARATFTPNISITATGFVFRDFDVSAASDMTVAKIVSICCNNSNKDIFLVGLNIGGWDPSQGLPNRYGPSTPAYPKDSNGTPWNVCTIAEPHDAVCPTANRGLWGGAAGSSNGISITGSTAAINHVNSPICWSVIGNTVRWTSRAIGMANVEKGVFYGNELRYFTGDGFDLYTVGNLIIAKNLILDRVDRRDGDHPDAMQWAVSNFNYEQWTFSNFVVAYNTLLGRTDASMPIDPAGNETWGYNTGLFNTDGNYNRFDIFDNVIGTTSSGTAINLRSPEGLVANNSLAGGGRAGASAEIWMGGYVNGDQIFANNVANGFSRAACADGSTFMTNYAIGYIEGDNPFSTPNVSACQGGLKMVSANPTDGVFIDNSDPSSSNGVFNAYNPPGNMLITSSNFDLTPNPRLANNPLVGGGSTSAQVSTQAQWPSLTVPPVNQSGTPWPGGTPNIGAY